MSELLEERTFEFSSEIENINIVERFIDEVCDTYKVGEENYGNILIALTEAVNNAISHGNRRDPSKTVVLTFKPSSEELIFVIEDEGPGFDYDNLPDPTAPENIEQPNGRGVYLMRHLADNVTFDETGSTVELKFNHKMPVELA
ncbi:MAG: ATP-binding protein [Flavobacteriales bacterium]|nr:ATP-binding protein [Flavobacteriales bacterium]NNK80124.1 ATP-binding protein [Flavobacteriales bacterium]